LCSWCSRAVLSLAATAGGTVISAYADKKVSSAYTVVKRKTPAGINRPGL
jgi:hypothetical protein